MYKRCVCVRVFVLHINRSGLNRTDAVIHAAANSVKWFAGQEKVGGTYNIEISNEGIKTKLR